MELPNLLRQAVDAELVGTPVSHLRQASEILTRRYRAETRDGRFHIGDELAAKAYLAARLPATYAAVRASVGHAAELLPDFSPRTLLDVGAGPGTAFWAVADCFTQLQSAVLIEGSTAIRDVGSRLAASHELGADGAGKLVWLAGDLVKDRLELPGADMVSVAYVLDEMAPAERQRLIAQLWTATQQVLLIVEPGTPAGWLRILAAREQLLQLGAKLAAPCPHQQQCPVQQPDWCHFSQRVARSKVHRLTKDADVPWEDEKYCYLVATRVAQQPIEARVIAPVRVGGGKVQVKLCQNDGLLSERLITKRDGDLFRWARRADWGDAQL